MLFFSKRNVPFKEIIPDGYIDIHSHLIPGIDDGVKTVYQSAYILEQFEKLGIKKVITTPHVIKDVWPNSSLTITNGLKELKNVLKPLEINKINIQASAEYMLDTLFFERVINKDILPLHKNFILVEMSTFSPPINLNEMLFEIKLAGYTPILAHPERYSYYQNDIKKFEELKNSGFRFQLNLLSLSGYYGDKVKTLAKKLLDLGYIDFTGSDIHNYHQLEVLKKGIEHKTAKKVALIMQNNIAFA
ncbi:tyrosine-protein phosphatase [Aquimarina algicola]|uniref:protein-tyrosine-phosphatase n=1 Tax=Aquimarina algicola TaxID=2589995 RepID=A0A504JQM1_9FLAO|nr:CpsB/CapC family capsule biosynthesis tyrosine phosphatase [Aquimarina algicola]TPN89101.1 histidinol phosphatase [Aquimarina algicola]